ncbi:MAG TPA: isoprenylcysteine carboxylmethyltransferase family protein [Candidatus Acidoferrales bacterium]|nr:isoprenylcysteine carboxylmethyltransferase family protein [Candidatus Acidoferrales bacterium]
MTQGALSRILLVGLLLLFLLVRLFFTIKKRREGGRIARDEDAIAREGKSNFTFRRIIFGPVLTFFIVLCCLNPSWLRYLEIPYSSFIMWFGAVMALAGIALLAWTHLCLGKEWSVNLQLRDDHRLIRSGPYSEVRHPMYTALFFIYIGLGLISNDYVAFILILMAVISLLLRIPREEDMMIEKFGEEYRTYIKKTGKFFPKLG